LRVGTLRILGGNWGRQWAIKRRTEKQRNNSEVMDNRTNKGKINIQKRDPGNKMNKNKKTGATTRARTIRETKLELE
jgi:hypothetical protein